MSYHVMAMGQGSEQNDRSHCGDAQLHETAVNGRRPTMVRLWRFVVVAAVVLAMLVAFAGWSSVSGRSQAVAEEPSQMVTYTVRPGDTLWSYAEKFTPRGGDVSRNVEKLVEINGLDSTWLEPGQKLLVPSK